MKTNQLKFTMALILIVFGVAVIPVALAQSGQDKPMIALDGLDPVLLTQGREELGKTTITTIHGRFQYFFANEANLAKFISDKRKYEIQLGGACARMGPQVGGHGDLFTVYEGRIYIFGSNDCKEHFEASPNKYLEPAIPASLNYSDAAFRKGKSLIEKVVTESGGAARIEGIKTYRQVSQSIFSTSQGEVTIKSTLARDLPDHYRLERERPWGKSVDVITPGASFQVFTRGEQTNKRDLTREYGQDLTRGIRRSVIDLLKAGNHPGFSAAYTGKGRAGEKQVEIVEVLYHGNYLKLGIDPAAGRIVSLSFIGRNSSTGEIGEVVQILSDYRKVDGVDLPFKVESSIDGQRDDQGTMTILEISLNEKLEPSLFAKP